VGKKIWHESQKAKRLPDGGLELTLQVAGLEEIKRWVLSLGPEAEVLGPDRLIEMIREDLTRTLGQYYQGASTVGLSIKGFRKE
jgi:predicted DNA-binding transcriptional regulator YafY